MCISACVFATFISPVLSSNNLPSGYTELEYIESTGTQWIDTGITIDDTCGVYAKFTRTGSRDGVLVGLKGDGHSRWAINPISTTIISLSWNTYVNTVFVRTDLNTAKLNFLNDRKKYLNDVEIGTITDTLGSTASKYTVLIFASHWGSQQVSYPQTGQIYNIQISRNTDVIANFIPARRNSDNVLGMYDTVTNAFFINSGTGNFIAGPAVVIQVATTKYVEEQFAPISTELTSTIGKIEKVVENTITQADRISALHTGKQNRPDDYNASEKCPAGRNCLLVADETGTVHWYPICDADGSVEPLAWAVILESLTSNGNNSYYAGNTTTYNELGNTGSAKTLQPGSNDGVRQLNETEWAVKWNGKGVVYGTSVCNDNRGHSLGEISNIAQPENKGSNCWCKMTSVADTNGTASETSINLSVYYGEYYYSGPCALNCAGNCAYYVQYNAEVRSAIFGLSN